MAEFHVNSANGSPVSPFDTWAKAANTIAAAAALATGGDDIWVHPSHSETAGASFSINGTAITNPARVVCGTPGATNGITALQNTASWSMASSGASATINGSIYWHGIQFKISGASGTATLQIGTVAGSAMHFNECSFQYIATGSSAAITFSNSATAMEYQFTFTDCSFRYGGSSHTFRFHNRVIMNGITFILGVSPTTMFLFGSSTAENPGMIDINGIDFSNLSSAVLLMGATTKMSVVRIRNAKVPAGWTSLVASSPGAVLQGTRIELLNYAEDDKNYKFWIEERQGKATDEVSVKRTTNPASDGTTAYSMHLQTSANVGYPLQIFRSPPIIKRHAAAPGTTRTVAVQVAHDGASAFTDKEIWLEVEYLGTAGFPLAKFASDKANYLSAAAGQPASGVAWDNATGTGPNGSGTWHRLQLETPSITVEEEGYLIGTVCMAVPSKHLYVDPQLNVTVV